MRYEITRYDFDEPSSETDLVLSRDVAKGNTTIIEDGQILTAEELLDRKIAAWMAYVDARIARQNTIVGLDLEPEGSAPPPQTCQVYSGFVDTQRGPAGSPFELDWQS
jgi:hypothetical protein